MAITERLMVVIIAAVAGVCGYQLLTPSSSTVDLRESAAPISAPPGEGRVALGRADGAVPDRTTVFDDDDLKAVGESLEPGSSALIAIAEDKVVENLAKGLEGYDRLSRHILSADAAAVLLAEAAPATT